MKQPPGRVHWPPGISEQIAPPTRSLWVLLMTSAEASPDKVALVFGDATLTYAELVARAERLAGWLQQRAGLQRGERVLLWSQNCLEFVIASYAVLRADAVVVPVNAMWTGDEVAHVLQDSGARIAISAAEFLPRLQPMLDDGRVLQVLAIDAGAPADVAAGGRITAWQTVLNIDAIPRPHSAGPADLAVLPYTSGTTGRPKGCMHTHGTVQSANRAAANWRSQGPGDVFLAVAPLFHALGMQNGMHLPLMLGASVVMLPRWSRDAALALIARHGVTTWAAPPAMLQDFFANPALTPELVKSLKLVTGGSSPMPEALAETMYTRYGIRYQEGYGMTETASFLIGNPPQRPRLGSLGMPGPGVGLRVIDPDTLEQLPPGQVGEIVAAGPQLTSGYWRQPEATAAAFITLEGGRYLRTGDLGHEDGQGYWFMTDRLKRMISVSGYKVWPAEVEAKLQSHPAVREACVIGTPDAKSGEAVKALVVRAADAAIDAAQLIAWCREAMAVYKAPKQIEFVAALPKSNTGKVLWRELQQQEQGR